MSCVACLIIIFLLCNSAMAMEMELFRSALTKSNYSKYDRPNIDGDAVNVTVQISLISLGPVKEDTFTYEVQLYYREFWNDPRLVINASKKAITFSRPPEELLWVPDIFISNARLTNLHKLVSRRTMVKTNGDVYYSKRIKATCDCIMDLRSFPMDTQYCPLSVESYSFNKSDVNINWKEVGVVYSSDLRLVGYTLQNVSWNSKIIRLTVGDVSEKYDNLTAIFELKRTFNYHIVKIYLPSILLMVFNCGSYWIPCDAVPARTGLIVTTFLANAFVLQSATEQTAPVDEITALQMFLVVNLALLVFSVVQYLAILQFSKTKAENKITVTEVPERLNREECTDFVSNPHGRSTCDVHWLDSFSRVVVPFVYTLFCTGYFVYYIYLTTY